MRSRIAETKLKEYLALSEREKVRYELASIDSFNLWSRKTVCIFMYVYANNELNRKLGRVGKISGFRTGTRNLDLVMASDRPRGRNLSPRTIQYYDYGRASSFRNADGTSSGFNGRPTVNGLANKGQWRSFRRDSFSIMIEIYSFVKGKFVSNFDEFYDRATATG